MSRILPLFSTIISPIPPTARMAPDRDGEFARGVRTAGSVRREENRNCLERRVTCAEFMGKLLITACRNGQRACPAPKHDYIIEVPMIRESSQRPLVGLMSTLATHAWPSSISRKVATNRWSLKTDP